MVGVNDGKSEGVGVSSTGGEICLAQRNVDDEDALVAIRPEDVPAVIEQLRSDWPGTKRRFGKTRALSRARSNSGWAWACSDRC